MQLFICVVPVCAVRSEPSHRSEQVTQMLFGERCQLLQQTPDFVQVRLLYDNYEGWCQAAQLAPSAVENFEEHTNLAGGFINEVSFNNTVMQVPLGAQVCYDHAPGLFGQHQVAFSGGVINTRETITETTIKQLATLFLNVPYLWGGRSVFGIDCSGLTQMVYKCLNVPLLRDASQQATQGEVVGFLQEVKCGDLAFFDNEAGQITHVGILFLPDTIIHASGKVRIDTIDTMGIVNRETGRRTHKLRIVKRLLDY